MSKNQGPQDLDSHKSSKSKFTKSTLALAGAGVLAGAFGGQALAADRSDDDLSSASLTPAGHSSVSPSSLQAAYKGVQDTMNWCSENPYTTAGIVFGAIAAVAIGVYGADIYDGVSAFWSGTQPVGEKGPLGEKGPCDDVTWFITRKSCLRAFRCMNEAGDWIDGCF